MCIRDSTAAIRHIMEKGNFSQRNALVKASKSMSSLQRNAVVSGVMSRGDSAVYGAKIGDAITRGAVSYTHLDVYKRQGAILVNISYYICQAAIDLSNVLGYSILNLFTTITGQVGPGVSLDWNGTIAAVPVSYTHLDVYKRQVVNRFRMLYPSTLLRSIAA